MRPTTYFLSALVLGLTLGLAAEAQADAPKDGPAAGQRAGQRRQPPSFEQLDKNGDGKLVASEVPARAWQRLSKADTNKDNAVTKAELDAMRAQRGNRGPRGQRPSFEQLDKNGDGKLVASEVPAQAWQRLSKADTNKDNAVTKAELDAMRTHRGDRGPRCQRPSFEQLDKNGDGKLVASEVPARAWQRLSKADANKDNAVTKAELEAARNARKGQRGR